MGENIGNTDMKLFFAVKAKLAGIVGKDESVEKTQAKAESIFRSTLPGSVADAGVTVKDADKNFDGKLDADERKDLTKKLTQLAYTAILTAAVNEPAIKTEDETVLKNVGKSETVYENAFEGEKVVNEGAPRFETKLQPDSNDITTTGQMVVNLNKGTRLPRISPTMTPPDTVEPSKTFTEFTNKIKNGDFSEFNYWYKQCGGAFYDRGQSTGKVGLTAEEFFEKLLSSKGAIKNNICVNSADFGAQVFKAAGYDAGVVMGGNSKGKPHSYLIADLKNGQYMINDYGKAYIIDAENADAALNKFFEQTGYAASGTIAGATFNNGGSVNSTGLPYAPTAPVGSDVSVSTPTGTVYSKFETDPEGRTTGAEYREKSGVDGERHTSLGIQNLKNGSGSKIYLNAKDTPNTNVLGVDVTGFQKIAGGGNFAVSSYEKLNAKVSDSIPSGTVELGAAGALNVVEKTNDSGTVSERLTVYGGAGVRLEDNPNNKGGNVGELGAGNTVQFERTLHAGVLSTKSDQNGNEQTLGAEVFKSGDNHSEINLTASKSKVKINDNNEVEKDGVFFGATARSAQAKTGIKRNSQAAEAGYSKEIRHSDGTGHFYSVTASADNVSGFGLGASATFGNVSSIPDAQKARSDAKDAVEELFSKKSKLADTKFTRGGEEL